MSPSWKYFSTMAPIHISILLNFHMFAYYSFRRIDRWSSQRTTLNIKTMAESYRISYQRIKISTTENNQHINQNQRELDYLNIKDLLSQEIVHEEVDFPGQKCWSTHYSSFCSFDVCYLPGSYMFNSQCAQNSQTNET